MNEGGLCRLPGGVIQRIFLTLLFINIVYTEECTGEGGGFAKGDKDGLVDLTGGVNIDAAEEQYQASEREDKGCYEL